MFLQISNQYFFDKGKQFRFLETVVSCEIYCKIHDWEYEYFFHYMAEV